MNHSMMIVAVLAGCSGSNPDATKSGVTVLTWQLSESDRATIHAAKLSDQQSKDIEYEAKVADDATVKVSIHLETATAVFTEEGKEVTHTAPIKVEVKVVDANGFTLGTSPVKCSGPHYDMELPPGRDMILECNVSAKKPKYNDGFSFRAYGDGRIDDGKAKPMKVPTQ